MATRIKVGAKRDTVLLLEDGSNFLGFGFGKVEGQAFGEVVFNTGMSGYQEVLTDPSYWQQLVVMTYPHQGNYGINSLDVESLGGVKAAGFVVHENVSTPSNFSSEQSLSEYLRTYGVRGISGVDTRGLTLHLRDKGAMRGLILSENEFRSLSNPPQKVFERYPKFEGRDLILEISTRKPYWFSERGSKTVVAVDFGIKLNLLRMLAERDLKVFVVPARTSAADILAIKPDGVFLSNGPGDPSAATYAIEMVKGLLGKVPIFGVCMGHQILGLALGGKTYKMKFGHRGANQPVFNEIERRVEISSHNHGYAVDAKSFGPNSGVSITHVNLNDEVCEGLAHNSLRAFSVQYHPEAAPGPHDSDYLFDRFRTLMSR